MKLDVEYFYKHLSKREISGSHGGKYEVQSLLGYTAM
jgi:hypothetical protein